MVTETPPATDGEESLRGTPPATEDAALRGCAPRATPGPAERLRNWWHDRGSGTAYDRLDGTLTAYCAEFGALLDELDRLEAARGDGPAVDRDVVTHVETLLDRAASHLQRGHIDQGWVCFHAARRVDLYVYAAYDRLTDGETDLVRERTVEIHREAMDRLSGWRREAVSDLLLDRSGQVRRHPPVSAVMRARHLVDEANQSNHAKRRYLQRQLRYLLGIGIVALTVFMLGVTRANPLAVADVTIPTFALYVPLLGALGASLFGVRSVSKTATSMKVPQNFTPLGVVLARVFIGSLSAVALYFGLTAEVVNVTAAAATDVSPALLLLVAFAAGYSERLAPQAIERVSQITGREVSA
ncbi:hypothetical protein [Haloplanus aerogenes]|uniref:Uncharacterized protein n=1 Tax=Haloplanus aerogenes TaxID=660522 RepID=A0A3M0DT41_9EURY|nr:hypothetical protein [Haloplanus aerogenes]AZH26057.1 hypothetical protein DU502_12120 [Haloplanus aerogenes]RMB18493.1 hypothetical protein ATH50_1953 [Haloplanus aerogenes]